MKPSKIIYSINIEDVQDVAEEELGRKLTKRELKIIEDKIGDLSIGTALLILLYKIIYVFAKIQKLKYDG
jgi:hypothetical protein